MRIAPDGGSLKWGYPEIIQSLDHELVLRPIDFGIPPMTSESPIMVNILFLIVKSMSHYIPIVDGRYPSISHIMCFSTCRYVQL